MSTEINRVEYPELFFGIVAPIGVDFRETVNHLDHTLRSFGYKVVQIKVTSVFPGLNAKLPLGKALNENPLETRYSDYIAYGDAIRSHFNEDAFFAATTVARVMKERTERAEGNKPEKVAYIMYQFKRKEEIELLRSVYGRLFFQVSVYTKRSSRVDTLARKIANSRFSADHNSFRPQAETLV